MFLHVKISKKEEYLFNFDDISVIEKSESATARIILKSGTKIDAKVGWDTMWGKIAADKQESLIVSI